MPTEQTTMRTRRKSESASRRPRRRVSPSHNSDPTAESTRRCVERASRPLRPRGADDMEEGAIFDSSSSSGDQHGCRRLEQLRIDAKTGKQKRDASSDAPRRGALSASVLARCVFEHPARPTFTWMEAETESAGTRRIGCMGTTSRQRGMAWPSVTSTCGRGRISSH